MRPAADRSQRRQQQDDEDAPRRNSHPCSAALPLPHAPRQLETARRTSAARDCRTGASRTVVEKRWWALGGCRAAVERCKDCDGRGVVSLFERTL